MDENAENEKLQRKLDQQIEEVSLFQPSFNSQRITSEPSLKLATSLTLLYNTVAVQVSRTNTLLELAEVHGKFLGAWTEFLSKGAATISKEN